MRAFHDPSFHLKPPRLLLHTETRDGSVIPVWEEVDSENVSVLKDIMASRRRLQDGIELKYARIPITAERPPDFSDLNDLIDVAVRNPNAPIVVNCQLGRGRSTVAAVRIQYFHPIRLHINNAFLDHTGVDQAVARGCKSYCRPSDSSLDSDTYHNIS